ncbi:MAG TPA: hypothetical protein VFR44_09410 [Actinomycetota bacterium]|nr:hypothetical protein [Actinomycetota bacterium]
MGEVTRGGHVPGPVEGSRWVLAEHQKDLSRELQLDHLAKEAGRRHGWWPFGKKRRVT